MSIPLPADREEIQLFDVDSTKNVVGDEPEIDKIEEKYTERLNELTDFCLENWGVESRATRLIAATLLNPAPLPPCWMIVDSDRHSFWDDLCQALNRIDYRPMQSASRLRFIRPRWANNSYEMEMMERNVVPKLLLDYEWERNVYVMYKNRWKEFQAEFIRMRVKLPACKLASHTAEWELAQRLRKCISVEHRPFLPGYWQLPEYLITHLNLLMKLNPELRNPSRLTSNISILGSSLAVLHGRKDMNIQDHTDIYHILLSQIRPWTRKILQAMADWGGRGMTVLDIMSMAGIRDRKMVVRECTRLANVGVISWKSVGNNGPQHKYLKLDAAYGPDVKLLLKMDAKWWV
ncbi:MAG TPA: hypothetical protein VF077_06160 [Nitrospiraceae bacterium]